MWELLLRFPEKPKCDTMCHMEKTSVRELHLRTSALIKNVAQGQTYIIESRGVPVAELRPLTERRKGRKLPNREAFIRTLPRTDVGRILEEDRR
jgi:antitoxin (DNA-binding transcriptional repressor) of toxin-antitoxin stability system